MAVSNSGSVNLRVKPRQAKSTMLPVTAACKKQTDVRLGPNESTLPLFCDNKSLGFQTRQSPPDGGATGLVGLREVVL
jgi:hypothetical protein